MKGHRLLKEGEILQKGDFWINKDGSMCSADGNVGQRLVVHPCYRPLKQAKKKKRQKRINLTERISNIIFYYCCHGKNLPLCATDEIIKFIQNSYRRRRKTS